MRKGTLNQAGEEVLDPRPVAIPAGFKRPETLQEQVARLVRTSVSEWANRQGMETFEESEDFEVDDEFDPQSRFETFFDPILGRDLSAEEFRRNEAAYRQQFLDREAARARAEDAAEARAEAVHAAKSRRRKPKKEDSVAPPAKEAPKDAQ